MKNIDKIKVLENQLEHESNQVKQLREENTRLREGMGEISQMCDAVITEIVKRYGDKLEEEGKLSGYRLATSKVDVKTTIEAWEIAVEDQGAERAIVISPREISE